MATVDSYASKRAAALAGVTFRRLDYWCRTGVLPDRATGSGSRRRFSFDEVMLMAIVDEVSTGGSVACLDAFREHRERLLDMLDSGVQFLAMIDGDFFDGASVGELVDRAALAPVRAVSWIMIDVNSIRMRVNGRRARAVSVALA